MRHDRPLPYPRPRITASLAARVCASCGNSWSLSGTGRRSVHAKALRREGLAVANAHGIAPELSVERAYGSRPSSPHKSSMLQDFERGRPPEIDGLLTAVQQFARAAAAPTPHLDAVTALIVEKARKAGLYPAAEW